MLKIFWNFLFAFQVCNIAFNVEKRNKKMTQARFLHNIELSESSRTILNHVPGYYLMSAMIVREGTCKNERWFKLVIRGSGLRTYLDTCEATRKITLSNVALTKSKSLPTFITGRRYDNTYLSTYSGIFVRSL